MLFLSRLVRFVSSSWMNIAIIVVTILIDDAIEGYLRRHDSRVLQCEAEHNAPVFTADRRVICFSKTAITWEKK